MLRLGLFTALVLFAAPAAALTIPDCAGLDEWSRTTGPDAPFNADGGPPAPFAEAVTAAVFGAPFLDWSADDIRALDDALNECRAAARRSKAAAQGFADARRIVREAGALLAHRERARERIAAALTEIDAEAPAPALQTALAALAAAPEGEMGRVRSNHRAAARIAQAAGRLSAAEQAALAADLSRRAEAMAGAIGEERIAALATLPETLEGALGAREAAHAAMADLGPAGASIAAAAAAREASIAATLAAASPAPVTLPQCGPLLDWGAALRPGQTRRARAGNVLAALEAPELEALFGKPFEAWTPADLQAFTALAGLCRAAARGGLMEGDRRERGRAAQNLVSGFSRAGDQFEVFAALKASRTEAARIVDAAGAAPAGVDGLVALDALRAEVGAAKLEDPDALIADNAIEVARAERAAQEIERLEAAMASAPAGLAGLEMALDARAEAADPLLLGAHLGADEVASVMAAFTVAAARLVPGAEAELKDRLAALPETPEGLEEASALGRRFAGDSPALASLVAAAEARAVEISGVVRLARLPEFKAMLDGMPETKESLAETLAMAFVGRLTQPADAAVPAYVEAAEARAAALRDGLAAARCAGPLAEIDEADAARPVLIGAGVKPLGRLLCALGAAQPARYEAPGLFGSEHVINAAIAGGRAVKLVLEEGEAPLGGEALIGVRVEDAGGARDVSTAEWQDWSAAMVGVAGCGAQAGFFARTIERGGDNAEAAAHALANCLIEQPDEPIPGPD